MTYKCLTGSAGRSPVGCRSRHLRRTFSFLRSKRRKRKSRRSSRRSCHLLELTNHESCAKKTVVSAGTHSSFVAYSPELYPAARPISLRFRGKTKAIPSSGNPEFSPQPCTALEL